MTGNRSCTSRPPWRCPKSQSLHFHFKWYEIVAYILQSNLTKRAQLGVDRQFLAALGEGTLFTNMEEQLAETFAAIKVQSELVRQTGQMQPLEKLSIAPEATVLTIGWARLATNLYMVGYIATSLSIACFEPTFFCCVWRGKQWKRNSDVLNLVYCTQLQIFRVLSVLHSVCRAAVLQHIWIYTDNSALDESYLSSRYHKMQFCNAIIERVLVNSWGR